MVSVATFLANRSVSDGRGPVAASPRTYRLRQNPPMSRLRPNLSNFAGARFVAQFLPITPQPAFFLVTSHAPHPSPPPPGKPAKVCGLRRRYHL